MFFCSPFGPPVSQSSCLSEPNLKWKRTSIGNSISVADTQMKQHNFCRLARRKHTSKQITPVALRYRLESIYVFWYLSFPSTDPAGQSSIYSISILHISRARKVIKAFGLQDSAELLCRRLVQEGTNDISAQKQILFSSSSFSRPIAIIRKSFSIFI